MELAPCSPLVASSSLAQVHSRALTVAFMHEQVTSTEVLLAARCKKVYANAHTYHINSISVNSDQETFLSADDLRINLWNLEVTEQSFNIVDIKPSNMEDLTEVSLLKCQFCAGRKRGTWLSYACRLALVLCA